MINTKIIIYKLILLCSIFMALSCKSKPKAIASEPDQKATEIVETKQNDIKIEVENVNYISVNKVGNIQPIIDTYDFAKGVTRINVNGRDWKLVFVDSLGKVVNVLDLPEEHYYKDLPFERTDESLLSKIVYKTSNEEVVKKGFQIYDFAQIDDEIDNYDISILEAETTVHIQDNGYVAVYFLIWTYNTGDQLIGISNGWTKIYNPKGELIQEHNHGGDDIYITSDGKYMGYIGSGFRSKFNMAPSLSAYFYRLSDLKLIEKYTAKADDDGIALSDMFGDAFVLGIGKLNNDSYIRVYNLYTKTVYENKRDRSLDAYGIGRGEDGFIYRDKKTGRRWTDDYKNKFKKIKKIKL